MKPFIFLSFLLIFSITCIKAQENRKAIDINLGYKLSETEPTFNGLSSYSWKLEEKRFFKVSLYSGFSRGEVSFLIVTPPNQVVIEQRFDGKDLEVGVGLQGNYKILEDEKLLIYAGWAVGYKYVYQKWQPITSDVFLQYTHQNIALGGGSAGLNWNFYKKFYLNLEAVIYVAEFGLEQIRIENPNIPPVNRSSSGINFNLGASSMIKIGVGKYIN